MARAFVAATEQYLEIDQTPVVDPPFSFGCWFRSTSLTDIQTLMCIADKDVTSQMFRLFLRGDVAGDPVQFNVQSSSAISIDTTTGYSANVWQHALAVEASSANHSVYLNGANKGNSTTTRSPTAVDRVSIGRLGDSTPQNYMAGHIAEAAIWNVALTDAEAAILAGGVSPRFVRPESLMAYWPLWGLHSPEIDLAAGLYPLTLFNAPTVGNHASVARFTRGWAFEAAPAAGPADVVIDAGASINTARVMRAIVSVSSAIAYKFFIDADTAFKYSKSADGGATWAAPVTIRAASDQVRCADVWFDQWTPGDSGTLIHTACGDSTASGDIFYRTLDTSGDTLGTERIIASFGPGTGRTWVSLAKMRGGNIYAAWSFLGQRNTARSTDGGVNWTARDVFVEAIGDLAMLFPGNEIDNQDLLMLYLDVSANAVTVKVHDDSANTTTESATIATVTEDANDGIREWLFSGAIRHSDNHLIATVHTEYDVATADFLVFDINGTGSITQLTSIITNSDDIYYGAVHVADNGDIYVAYIGSLSSLENLGVAAGVYYVVSTDGGTTWGSEQAYSAGVSDWRQTWTTPSGPRFIVAWRDASDQRLLTNFTSSVVTGGITASYGAASIACSGVLPTTAKVAALPAPAAVALTGVVPSTFVTAALPLSAVNLTGVPMAAPDAGSLPFAALTVSGVALNATRTVALPISAVSFVGVSLSTSVSAALPVSAVLLSGVVFSTSDSLDVAIVSLTGQVMTAVKQAALPAPPAVTMVPVAFDTFSSIGLPAAGLAVSAVVFSTFSVSVLSVAQVQLTGLEMAPSNEIIMPVSAVALQGVAPTILQTIELPAPAVVQFIGVTPDTASSRELGVALVQLVGFEMEPSNQAGIPVGAVGLQGVVPDVLRPLPLPEPAGMLLISVPMDPTASVPIDVASFTFNGLAFDTSKVAELPVTAIELMGISFYGSLYPPPIFVWYSPPREYVWEAPVREYVWRAPP